MSGAIEVIINSSLLSALNGAINELPGRLTDLVNEAGFITQKHSVIEAPAITHNLETSIQITEEGPLTRMVYPDEGIAPYALFVILEGVTRRYGGNPFFDRAQAQAEEEIQGEVDQFEEWLKNQFEE